ncbi:Alpha/Beta hydrolase protein [Dipodascopsis tothii]|uniref:Alpha/Beta hydrolase protein n=1 Tax=Dipodascopsis tothii TaxID=44089 RepID=UPI0034CFF6D2
MTVSRILYHLGAFLAVASLKLCLAIDKSAADYYVKSLPGVPSELALPKMHAGHIEINPEHNGNLFFWHVTSKHLSDKPRTVIWLNGGPGCSSMDGQMMEIGPFRVGEGGILHENKGSWHHYTNLLFVDNPVGTGFSYVDSDSYLHDLPEMASDFLIFMDKFFDIFPEYETDDLYIAGESYAGMYIPYIADAMLRRNINATSDSTIRELPLKGILLGNGWIDPIRQYLAYLPFAYQSGLIQGGTAEASQVEKQHAKCVAKIEQDGVQIGIDECEDILDTILEVSQNKNAPDGKTCRNMYDLRKSDTFPACGVNWPEDLEFVTPYLRKPEVLAALHVNPEKKTGWTECSGAVGKAFNARHSKPAVDLMPFILENIPVVMFNGDQDLICNHVGNEDLITHMSWNGGTGFEETPGGTWAPRLSWTFEGEPAGIYQSARNLTYVLFYNCSHMVPFDEAERSRDMLYRFIDVDYSYYGDERPPSSIIGGDTSSNSTNPNEPTSEDEEKRIKEATRQAYYRAGEFALIFVIIAAIGFGAFVIFQRRRERLLGKKGGYRTVGFAKRDQMIRLEDGRAVAAGVSGGAGEEDENDINELDELVVESPVVTSDEIDRTLYEAGNISDDAESSTRPSMDSDVGQSKDR